MARYIKSFAGAALANSETTIYTVPSGRTAKVVGNAFALAANKLSAPIEGNTGVYVVKNISTVKAPALKSHAPYITKLKAQSGSDANRVVPALKANAKIEDNRRLFNY